jgi:guanyl-specific ribonuclease Sa
LDNFLQKFIYDDVGDGVGALANQQYASAALSLSVGRLKHLKNLKKWISSNPGQKIPGTKKGGGAFDNDGRGGGQVLPKKDANGKPITYKEYDVNPTAAGKTRDAERMVVGSDGRTYHTSDHYKTFTEIKD